MALIRWEPARELATIQGEMNRLFNTFFDPSGQNTGHNGTARRWIPAMDLVETDADFVLRADLPGLAENDVSIEVEDSVLTISGQRKTEHEERKEGYYRVERASGTFSRSLTLPEGVDPERVEASFDRGVLEVRIPKPEQRKPRKVTISTTGGATKAIDGSEHSEPADPAAEAA
jgi:HSP20 family protein